ncbi:alpha/beta hydrolase [Streptomyces sp. NPDC050738]|uniref:alpha/beta fold hydrolase n=1 Tax=Streptomyces sp. NPDC050738 TaxID=3154744 RepID=UPI00342C154F
MRVLVRGVRLHVSAIGEEWEGGTRRPAIVALHGGPGIDAGMLRLTMGPARSWAQVVVPDQRGHGRSDHADPSTWNLDEWADDVAELIDVLGLDRPLVLGTSFGGFVVQHYLARYPEQAGGAVLVGSSPRQAGHDEIVERYRELGGDRAAAVMRRSLTDRSDEAERDWAEVCAPLSARRPPDTRVDEVRARRIATPEVNAHFIPTLDRLDLRPGLAAARSPVLVMVGELDPLVPPAVAAEAVDALPPGLGELCVVEGASHQVLWDQPERAHAAIEQFAATRLRAAATAP